MKQRGFSSVLVLVVAVVVIGGGVWWFTQQGTSVVDSTTLEDTATTSSGIAQSKETSNTEESSVKTKVKVCDLLSLSKVSSIVGVPMSYTPDLTEETKSYEDGDLWYSMCSFMESAGSVESNVGVTVMISEGLSSAAKTEIKKMFEDTKSEDGGVTVTGFGDKAFKVIDTSEFAFTSYYVMVGNMSIMAYSAVGKGKMFGERAELTGVEKKDAETEAILKHILSQLK